MLAHQRLELPDKPGVLAERQPRVDSILHSAKPRLAKPGDLVLGEALIGEVSHRLPTPQRQRVAQALVGSRRVTDGERAPAAGHQRFKAADVNPLARDREHVTVSTGHDHVVAERLAQLRDVALNDLDRARGRMLAPRSSISRSVERTSPR